MDIIYVDDEKLQLENFKLTTQKMEGISSLHFFSNSYAAYEWAKEHPVDVAFLDIEMPQMDGITLAKKLKEQNKRICIVFVTAYDKYALDSFEVRPIGYLLKPYDCSDIEENLSYARFLMNMQEEKKISITTMPDLLLKVNGKAVSLGHGKPEELFALLVDRGKMGVTKRDAVACLWEGKIVSKSTYATCLYRLKNILEEAGAPDLLFAKGNTRYLNTSLVDCDLYRMLGGHEDTIASYSGVYLRSYSWAEERTAQLNEIKKRH